MVKPFPSHSTYGTQLQYCCLQLLLLYLYTPLFSQLFFCFFCLCLPLPVTMQTFMYLEKPESN